MKESVVIPSAGESINEVDIQEWKFQDGDMVKTDDILAELETEKATLELRAPCDGVLKIKYPSGSTVKVGEVVAEIDNNGKGKTSDSNESSSSIKPGNTVTEKTSGLATSNATAVEGSQTSGQVVDIIVPAAGESINEADISKWFKANGDFVSQDDILLEVETEKASLEIRAEVSGILSIKVDSGVVKVGQTIGNIQAAREAPKNVVNSFVNTEQPSNLEKTLVAPIKSTSTPPAPGNSSGSEEKHTTPASRRLMQEAGVSIDQVTPTGKGGRIMVEDVINSIQATQSSSKSSVNSSSNSESATPVSSTGSDRTVNRTKMSRLRKTIANRLVQSQQTSALLTTFNEIDMYEVMKIRSKYKETFKKKHEVNLGFMSFFVQAACEALSTFPLVNAMIEEDEIVSYNFMDIGVAVSTPKGLVVPVIKDAQKKSFDQIEKNILDFALRGRDGSLGIDEMTGGTFTITNGGTFGSMLSTPIVNFPQSAILGMHNIVKRPVVVDDQVVIRPIMYVALTYDHRIIDGAEAVRFLYTIKEMIEDPHRLLIKV